MPPADPVKLSGDSSSLEQPLEAAPDAIVGVDGQGKIVPGKAGYSPTGADLLERVEPILR